MRFEISERADRDWRKLKPEERKLFRSCIPDFNTAGVDIDGDGDGDETDTEDAED